LIDSVGKMIQTRGFNSILLSKVARETGVDRKLIYRYFGNLNNLIEAYIVENDYWLLFAENFKSLLENEVDDSQAIITTILQEQFFQFLKDKEMQTLILLELSQPNPLMRSIHNARESLGQQFLELTDKHFQESNVNFRAVAALLVGGIYYMVLHTRFNGHKFADLDLKTAEGTQAITETLSKIVNWAYLEAVDKSISS
jgi:AcrR family transcriptional regulator